MFFKIWKFLLSKFLSKETDNIKFLAITLVIDAFLMFSLAWYNNYQDPLGVFDYRYRDSVRELTMGGFLFLGCAVHYVFASKSKLRVTNLHVCHHAACFGTICMNIYVPLNYVYIIAALGNFCKLVAILMLLLLILGAKFKDEDG